MYKLAFTYKCLRDLYAYSGQIDALLHLNELANRELISQAKQSSDVRTFIIELSRRHKISTDLSRFDGLLVEIAKNYTVTVDHSAERFLVEFRKEHQELFDKKWKEKQEGESWLDNTIINIFGSRNSAIQVLGEINLEIFDYYHGIRNYVVHPRSEESRKKKIDEKFNNLKKHQEEITKLHQSSLAPNAIETLKFEDFKLFSKVVKHIALELCKHENPSDEQIIKIFNISDLKKRIKHNPKRLQIAVEGELRTVYGLDKDRASRLVSRILAH